MAPGAGRIFAINLLANSDPAQKAFRDVGKAAGRIPGPLKVAAVAITAVFAAVTTVALKSFKELLQLGEEFNEVSRIIRVGTGAVGDDLAALEDSFRNIAGNAPNAFADIADVVAELDTRTDLAGDGLEEMATKMLTLSRLMGGDAKATTREVTRLFNRFGLEADEASDMLDVLFRASQASGGSVDQLAADVTKNAGALIGMGLSLEESVALFGIFEREGVRSRTVVSALQTGFLKLTREGSLPLNEALAETFTELQTLDRAAAEQKGFDIFGTSALELVDAVRDGRLDIEDFTRAIVDGEIGIEDTAEATDGYRVKLDELKNFLKLEFEDVAREVFKNVTAFVEELKPAAQRVSDAFEEDGLQGALAQVAEEWDRIYEDKLQPLFIKLLEFLNETVKPIALEVGKEIGGAIASGIGNAALDALKGLGPKLMRGVLAEAGGEQFGLFGSDSPGQGKSVADIARDLGLGVGVTNPSTAGGVRGGNAQIRAIQNMDLSNLSSQLANLPRMAEGGVVTRPTLAMIGEAGPEAVIPLGRGGMGGDTINITVTSADPQAVVEALRKYTRANGPLGSVVSV